MKKVNKITMMVGTTIAMLSTTILATTGIVNAPSGLVLRGEAVKGGSVITTVEDDAKVEILEESGEWYKVRYNGQEGYLFAEYVEKEEPVALPTNTEPVTNEPPITDIEPNAPVSQPGSLVGTSMQLKNEAKIHVIPLITSESTGTIAVGTTVTVQKEITNWSYVTDGTNEGWIRTYSIQGEMVSQENPTTQTPEPPVEQQPETPEVEQPNQGNIEENPSTVSRGTISVDYANVRKEASQSAEIVTTLSNGTTVTISAETEEWYKITYTGTDGTVYDGYIAKRLVTAE